jgi:hypothetical protein
MISRRFAPVAVAIVLMSACSGGGSGSSTNSDARVAAASGLAVETDGFAFANFGSANTPEVMNGEDLRAMFGDGVCTNGASTPCAPTSEAAAWAQMVNQSRQAGHCEGMVVQALNRFSTSATPKTSELKNQADTTHGIIRAFATQFFPAVKKESDSWAKKSVGDIVAALNESFSSQKITYSMGLYSDMGGHAVLPLSVEYPTESTAKVHIYDTNWPGQDRYVLVDLEADTWEFSFSGQDPLNDPNVWTGGKGDIDLASMENRLSTDAPFETGSNGVLGNFLVIRSASLDWSVRTPTGVVSPTDSTDATATVRPLRTAATKSVPEYIVTTSSPEIDLTLPGISSAYAVGGGKVISVVTRGTDEPITIKPTRVVFPAAATLSLADGDLAATVTGGSGYIDVNKASLTISVSGMTEEVTVNTQKPQVTVTVKNGKGTTTTGSAITTPQPTLPTELVQPDTKQGLPPQTNRTLAAGIATSTTVAGSATTTAGTNTTTTVKSTNGSTSTSSTTSTTTNNQNNIVALQYTGSQNTWTNGQPINATLTFRLINASNQWASTASGTCALTLLPEFDNGSLGGASLSGNTSASANGNGTCSFSSVTINGTSGVKYRLRASLNGSGANTTLAPFTLN